MRAVPNCAGDCARRCATTGAGAGDRSEPGSTVTRQSNGGLKKNFLSWVSCSRCSHSEIWSIISLWPHIWQSRVLCLGVTCGILKFGFFGRFFGYLGAMVGSTVDTCSATLRGDFRRIAHIFLRRSGLEFRGGFVSGSHAAWRSVLGRCFSSQSWHALLALGNLEITFTRLTWLATCVMMGRVSAQALAHVN